MRQCHRPFGPVFVSALMLLGGCQTAAHRDVLLFGTQTKFGIDIAQQPESQTPEFTVGYKRLEFVYLPLIANGTDSRVACRADGTCRPDSPLYQGEGGSADNPRRRDAYSVFASFGAKFGGGGSGTDGGLAQFFATGVAAQELGKNTSIGDALAVQPADGLAYKNAAQANAQAISVLSDALTEAERQKIDARVTVDIAQRPVMIDTILAMSRKGGTFDAATWSSNVDKLPDDKWKGEKAILKTLSTEDDVRLELELFHAQLVRALYDKLTH